MADTRHLIFNNRLDAAVTGFFALLILALLVEAATEWYRILTGADDGTPHRDALRPDEVGGGLAVTAPAAGRAARALAPGARVERRRRVRDLPRARGRRARVSAARTSTSTRSGGGTRARPAAADDLEQVREERVGGLVHGRPPLEDADLAHEVGLENERGVGARARERVAEGDALRPDAHPDAPSLSDAADHESQARARRGRRAARRAR